MKNFYLFVCLLLVNFLLLVSCSTEGEVKSKTAEKATLSFELLINDLTKAALKSHLGDDLPECSSETLDYVEIVLMQEDVYVVGTAEEPFRLNLEEGRDFTVEDPILELVPGEYSLVHFSVYNQDEGLLWIAPRMESEFGNLIQNPLPLQINLNSGVKKYAEVEVLCFDNREVTEYGYQFFELGTNEALKFCFFANYCDDTGRHYPAWFSVSIWSGLNNEGEALYTSETNSVGYIAATDDYTADPVCFILPDNEDMDEPYLYYEATLLDWPENYGDVDPMVISGTLSKRDILQNYVGGNEMEYEHLRFNCETETDSDGDGIPDDDDECPNEAGELNTGCPGSECVTEQPCSADFSNSSCVTGYFDFPGNHENSYKGIREPFPDSEILDPSTGQKLGVAKFSRNDSHNLVVTINSEENLLIGSYKIELHPAGDWECLEFECQNDAGVEEVEEVFTNFSTYYWVRLKISFCPKES